MDEEREVMTVETVMAEVIGTEAKRIVNSERESNAKEMEGLSKIVDSTTKLKESEANSRLELAKLDIEDRKITLEYDRMDHETEIERRRAFVDGLKTAASIGGIVVGGLVGVYAIETQKDLAVTEMEFNQAQIETMTGFEQTGIYTSQSSTQVLKRLGRKMIPDLITKFVGGITKFF